VIWPEREVTRHVRFLSYGRDMADPVPPNVTEDQLKLLLDQQSETEILDYKSELDLVDKKKKARVQVELAKDIAALLSGRGGHLVIGADGNGFYVPPPPPEPPPFMSMYPAPDCRSASSLRPISSGLP